MTDADHLRAVFTSLSVNEDFTEAMLLLSDESILSFRHSVGERRVNATGADAAARVLAKISRFRLNAKHLDIQFADGSRWEAFLGTSHQ